MERIKAHQKETTMRFDERVKTTDERTIEIGNAVWDAMKDLEDYRDANMYMHRRITVAGETKMIETFLAEVGMKWATDIIDATEGM